MEDKKESKKVLFWDSARDYLAHKEEYDEAWYRVNESGQLVLGYSDEIEKFEKDFASYIGVKHGIMTGGGTHALYLAYRALGIGPGDEVITTSHTFIATIDQITAVGATPILVDIYDNGMIDIDQIEESITSKTKAIVPVHLEGKTANTHALFYRLAMKNRHDIKVIEDAAQAIGATFRGKKAGAWGNVGCFSFYPAKILGSMGNAGMVVTDDDELAKKIRWMRCNWGIGKNPDLEGAEFGTQMEPDGIQAAILNVNFKYLDQYISRRAEIAGMYDKGLEGLPITLPPKQEGRVYQDYVILVDTKDKLKLLNHLKVLGVNVLGHKLIPNHHYKILRHFNLPKTDRYIEEQIRIPCRPSHTDEEIGYVVKTIRSFYER